MQYFWQVLYTVAKANQQTNTYWQVILIKAATVDAALLCYMQNIYQKDFNIKHIEKYQLYFISDKNMVFDDNYIHVHVFKYTTILYIATA